MGDEAIVDGGVIHPVIAWSSWTKELIEKKGGLFLDRFHGRNASWNITREAGICRDLDEVWARGFDPCAAWGFARGGERKESI
mmetsp:Transcript_919/g.2645  ORF Transcript_919/g.2645 Transcript_919/m.2645 type:complete len:83 (-) Transcript_919:80-328(-)